MGLNMVKCTPADDIKRQVLAVYELQDHVIEGDDQKMVISFFGEKVHPRRENPGYAYDSTEGLTGTKSQIKCLPSVTDIGVARGVQGVQVHPQGDEKIF